MTHGGDKKNNVIVKVKGVENDLDNLEDDHIVSMTFNEVEEEAIRIVKEDGFTCIQVERDPYIAFLGL